MSDDLQRILERLSNQKKEVAAFQGLVSAYTKDAITWRRVDNNGWTYFLATAKREPGVALEEMAGNILNVTRTCLDSLVCQLAVRNGKDTKGVKFPFAADEAKYADAKKGISKLDPADRQKIRDLQPWGGGMNDFLYQLHMLDIDRKHIDLTPAAAGSAGASVGGFNLGGNVQIENSTINGLPIPLFKARNGPLKIGQETQVGVGTNVPLGPHPLFSVSFARPDHLAQAPAADYLFEWIRAAEYVVRQFVRT
jgi:hypothetical protein